MNITVILILLYLPLSLFIIFGLRFLFFCENLDRGGGLNLFAFYLPKDSKNLSLKVYLLKEGYLFLSWGEK